jgi:RNA-directed DNA polymerase
MVSGTKADAEQLHGELAEVLAPIGLRLSEAKTRIAHIDEGFDFLGWRIHRHRKKGTTKRYVVARHVVWGCSRHVG